MKKATILKTRQHFVDIYRDCIKDAQSGKMFVNDVPSYVVSQLEQIDAMMAGKCDHTFTFLQRAHWLQTGESIPFLN